MPLSQWLRFLIHRRGRCENEDEVSTCSLASIDHLLMPVPLRATEGVFPQVSCPTPNLSHQKLVEERCEHLQTPFMAEAPSHSTVTYRSILASKNSLKFIQFLSFRLVWCPLLFSR